MTDIREELAALRDKWRVRAELPCGTVQHIRSEMLRRSADDLDALIASLPPVETTETEKPMKIWSCKIGEVANTHLPGGSDLPMRAAVAEADQRITGEEPMFLFSGWGAELTEPERALSR